MLLYLLVYTFMNLGAFGVIASLRQRDVIGDGNERNTPPGETEAVLMLISSCCRWLDRTRRASMESILFS